MIGTTIGTNWVLTLIKTSDLAETRQGKYISKKELLPNSHYEKVRTVNAAFSLAK